MLLAPVAAEGPDVPLLETREAVIETMIELAQVTDGDVVYDLGSEDGRIVIAPIAGVRGVGIEIQPELVEQNSASRPSKTFRYCAHQEQITTSDVTNS